MDFHMTVALSCTFTSRHSQPCDLPLLSTCADPWHAISFISLLAAECLAFICAVTPSSIRSDDNGS